jgi:peptidoglycan/LPS O-acetylase OafA/YrhL
VRAPRSAVNLPRVDPRRLSVGEWIAAIGSAVLVAALFLPWYDVGGRQVTAWQSRTVDDVLLALAGAGALAAALATARRRPVVPVAYTVLAVWCGVIAVAVAVWRIADPAPSGDAGLAVGAWLGLAGAVAVAVGSWAGASDEGPARRSEQAARSAAAAGRERAPLLPLPPNVRDEGSGERAR